MTSSKHKLTCRNSGALLGASALLSLAGCGGGSSNNGNNNNANSNLAPVNLVALTSDNRLLTFNARTPGTSTTVSITGLTTGDSLKGIDFRFTPATTTTPTTPGGPVAGFNGNNALYALGQNGTSQQLYFLNISGATATATAVGARFDFIPSAPGSTASGFDFNPTVDRLRLIEPTSNRDLRINPNNGALVDFDLVAAGVQPDGPLTYDVSDANAGKDPDGVGAAYTNPDADPATGTVLYVLDSGNNTLAIQGRADDPTTAGTDETVSPNSGRLFTAANLSIDLEANSGFDISPTGNAAFLSNGSRIYGITIAPGLGRGNLTGGARLTPPGNSTIIGLAALS